MAVNHKVIPDYLLLSGIRQNRDNRETSLIPMLDNSFVLVEQIFDEPVSLCEVGQAIDHLIDQVRMGHEVGNIMVRPVHQIGV